MHFTSRTAKQRPPGIVFYETEPLAVPILIEEGGPPTEIITLFIPHPQKGQYRASVGFVGKFIQANDRLTWRVTGTISSASDFLMESKEAGERVPFYHELSVELTGPTTIRLEAETAGPGQADVEVDTASIYLERVK